MLLHSTTLEALAARLQGDPGSYRFAVVETTVDPLAFVRAAAPFFGSARYLTTPGGPVIGGVGAAWRIQGAGSERFLQLEKEWATRPSMPSDARLFVGFAFSADGATGEEWKGFSPGEVVLPVVTAVADESGRRLVVAIPPGADPDGVLRTLQDLVVPAAPRIAGFGDHSVHSQPSGTEWCRSVDEAVAAIERGLLQKVVLARSVVVRTETTIDPFELVHQLGSRNPQCHAYGWQIGDAAFLGATPELLVGTRGEAVRANPLAGSAQRGAGDAEDLAVAEALMASMKDRSEHALVVDDIAVRLRPLVADLEVPDAPSVRRVATVQHLSTEITGRMVNGTSLFGLVDRLHPTPAVGGTPRSEAVAFIEKVEGMDRGWYSGGVGWIDPGGDGDVVIALRCGLVQGNQARLYAGNGIVAESESEAELVETRWKFRPLFNLLTAT